MINKVTIFTGLLSAIAWTPYLTMCPTAHGADKVTIRYGFLEESTSLTELKKATETGQLPGSLQIYTSRLSQEQRNWLVQGLRARIPINVVTLNWLLNTQLGQTVINEIAAVFDRRQDQSGVQAVRAGLILAASSPEGLSILSFIAAYPSQTLKLNLAEVLTVAKFLNMDFLQTQQFLLMNGSQTDGQKLSVNIPLDPTQPGTEKVEISKLNLNDDKRKRNIIVDIYRSNSANNENNIEKPLIVFSHSSSLVGTDLQYLAQHLASYGYTVAALQSPSSNFFGNKSKVGLNPQEFLALPQDVSFVLDELAKLNQNPNNSLRGKLATNKVMVVGYSLGGTTALALAGGELQIASLKSTCEKNTGKLSDVQSFMCLARQLPENNYQLQDQRVKQIVALKPASSLLFGETGLTKIKVPTLVFTASADYVTPSLTEQINGFNRIPSPKWLAAAVGASHLSVVDPLVINTFLSRTNPSITSREVVGDKSADVRNYVKTITLAMAAQLTPDANKYNVFLTPQYAQVASTPLFPFRLIKSSSGINTTQKN
ncbi:alpha/beta hydrolase [Cylindrospermopsis curvispora]|uniref:Alpha/beta hydrolase n=1 Tax=Cylindrospermopsis curvispora GIHE-G1 TaxID=2666332 RepID=A0A7H0EY20_9CYAN|nr:alpha/beta hydrolase [Cylindrospermopsis curvispora]QNP28686.1 alpha/beta hydrolase [Cylindrospermopsis curvispora GIHE-G1]